MMVETTETKSLQNTRIIHETGIDSRNIDVINLKDEKGNEVGKFVRFTVTIPNEHRQSEDYSFMVAVPKPDEFAATYRSGSGKIRIHEYSANDGTRMVARVFSNETDRKGVLVLPCLTPNPTPTSTS